MIEKQHLRAKLRKLRRDHVASLPEAMRGLVFHRPPGPVAALVPEGSIAALYDAVGAEAPTRAYAQWLYENGRQVALPWFANRGAPMRFRLWSDPWSETSLEPGPFRSLQPGSGADEVSPAALFVPLLGFTARCERIGQGAGHYDRWLAENAAVAAIGLAWDCQLVESLPLEAHDRRLDAVVTPTRIYEATR